MVLEFDSLNEVWWHKRATSAILFSRLFWHLKNLSRSGIAPNGHELIILIIFDLGHLNLIDLKFAKECENVHTEKDIHHDFVWASLLHHEVWILQPEKAQGWEDAQDKVQGEPCQVDWCIANEVLDGLLTVRVWVWLLANTFDHLPSDVCNCSENISVEAACLDQKPHHSIPLQWFNHAGSIVIAAKNLIGEHELRVEDGSLVDKDWQSVADAREELPWAISICNAQLVLRDLFNFLFNIRFASFRDIARSACNLLQDG